MNELNSYTIYKSKMNSNFGIVLNTLITLMKNSQHQGTQNRDPKIVNSRIISYLI